MAGFELKSPKITRCSWSDIWPAGEALFLEHRLAVVKEHPNLPYNMDFVLAQQYSDLGIMQCVAAHAEGGLIGYCIFFISPSIESAGIMCASQGPWFVTHEWRHSSVGFKMWKEAIAALRLRGVQHVLAHRYERSDPRLDDFFTRQGAEPFARVFSLVIGDKA